MPPIQTVVFAFATETNFFEIQFVILEADMASATIPPIFAPSTVSFFIAIETSFTQPSTVPPSKYETTPAASFTVESPSVVMLPLTVMSFTEPFLTYPNNPSVNSVPEL